MLLNSDFDHNVGFIVENLPWKAPVGNNLTI